jgi:hypothetical protein
MDDLGRVPPPATDHSERMAIVFTDTGEFPIFYGYLDPASGGTDSAEGFLVRVFQRSVRLRFRAQDSDS